MLQGLWRKLACSLFCLFAFLSFSASAAVPGSVSYFKASSTSVTDGTTITLSWGKPSGYSGTVKYNFYIFKPGDKLWKYKSLTTSTSLNRYMTILGTHKFYVEACNTEGACGPRSSLSVAVKEPVPGAVSSFRASSTKVTDGTTVSFSWGKPSGFSGAVKYNFYVYKPGDRLWKYKSGITSTSLSRYMTIAGTHRFYVEACNSSGACGSRSSVSVVVKPPAPAKVSSFLASSSQVTDGSIISLTWGAPSGYGYALRYNLYVQKPGASLVKFQSSVSTTSVNYTTSGTGTYAFYVEACNTYGDCGSRTSLNVVSKPPVPGSIGSFTATSSAVTDGERVIFNWSAPTGFSYPVTYNFYIHKPGDVLWKYHSLTSDTSLNRHMSISGTHMFYVEACNSDSVCGSRSSLSVEVSAPVPGPVASFSASKSLVRDGTTISLNWAAPADFTQALTYNVYVHKPGDKLWLYKPEYTETSLNRYMTITGDHEFHVEACNVDNVCGPRSSIKVSVIEPISVSQFTASSYEVADGETITLSWQLPGDITETVTYNLYVFKPGDQLWLYKPDYTSTSLGRYMTIAGTHEFYVEACDADKVCGPRASLSVVVKALETAIDIDTELLGTPVTGGSN